MVQVMNKIARKDVIEVPCHIDDTLYTFVHKAGSYLREDKAPYEARVVFIGINGSDDYGGGFVNVEVEGKFMWQFRFSDFGKYVFYTREEANHED